MNEFKADLARLADRRLGAADLEMHGGRGVPLHRENEITSPFLGNVLGGRALLEQLFAAADGRNE